MSRMCLSDGLKGILAFILISVGSLALGKVRRHIESGPCGEL